MKTVDFRTANTPVHQTAFNMAVRTRLMEQLVEDLFGGAADNYFMLYGDDGLPERRISLLRDAVAAAAKHDTPIKAFVDLEDGWHVIGEMYDAFYDMFMACDRDLTILVKQRSAAVKYCGPIESPAIIEIVGCNDSRWYGLSCPIPGLFGESPYLEADLSFDTAAEFDSSFSTLKHLDIGTAKIAMTPWHRIGKMLTPNDLSKCPYDHEAVRVALNERSPPETASAESGRRIAAALANLSSAPAAETVVPFAPGAP